MVWKAILNESSVVGKEKKKCKVTVAKRDVWNEIMIMRRVASRIEYRMVKGMLSDRLFEPTSFSSSLCLRATPFSFCFSFFFFFFFTFHFALVPFVSKETVRGTIDYCRAFSNDDLKIMMFKRWDSGWFGYWNVEVEGRWDIGSLEYLGAEMLVIEILGR